MVLDDQNAAEMRGASMIVAANATVHISNMVMFSMR
jgi:hypothetical protein